jgi:hypothetical protein
MGATESSTPIAPIQRPILDGLGEVGHGQVFDAFKIGDGAGDFEDAIMGAGGESLLLHGALEQMLGIGAQLAIGANLTGGHLRVGVDFLAEFAEALALTFAGGENTGADFS